MSDEEITGAPTDAAAPLLDPPHAHPSGFHRLNIAHLVMGMVFLCLFGAWLVVAPSSKDWNDYSWILPLPWLIAGGVGLVVGAIRTVRQHR